jgi:hypothetical protein
MEFFLFFYFGGQTSVTSVFRVSNRKPNRETQFFTEMSSFLFSVFEIIATEFLGVILTLISLYFLSLNISPMYGLRHNAYQRRFISREKTQHF